MRGELNGLKQKILDKNTHAYYVHCFAYQLQLVVVTASKSHGFVSSFFDHVAKVMNVIRASCKRNDAFVQKHHDDIMKRLESGDIDT